MQRNFINFILLALVKPNDKTQTNRKIQYIKNMLTLLMISVLQRLAIQSTKEIQSDKTESESKT